MERQLMTARGSTVMTEFNFKPSELPVGTVIQYGIYEYHLYLKKDHEEGTYWEDLFSGCGCCTEHEVIADAGFDCDEDDEELGLHFYDPRRLTTIKKSDDYFTEGKITIKALPLGWSIEAPNDAWILKEH
jgi:hypothetical protein